MRYALLLLCLFLFSCNSKRAATDSIADCYKLKQLTVSKHPVQPGEWRDSYTEVHEPLIAYTRRNPTATTAQRYKLYVVQLGTFDAAGKRILEDTKAYLQAFYQIPVAELPAIDIKVIASKYTRQNSYGLQIKTAAILDSLLPALLPDSAFALLAFSPYDLYPDENWNFVFGEASLERRVGVWSLSRLGNYHTSDSLFRKCRERTMQVAAHETGHIFGIRHCVQNECCMNGSNALSESDRQPLWLCWECLAKVCWNRHIAPQQHIKALLNFHNTITHDSAALAYYREAQSLLKQ